MSILLPLLLACATVPAPPPATTAGGAVLASQAGPPPVSFAPLEERVHVLLADTRDADQRDRLVAARELMHAMRNKDPIAQRKVYEYLDQVLAIEARSQPADIRIEGFAVPIEEETLVPSNPAGVRIRPGPGAGPSAGPTTGGDPVGGGPATNAGSEASLGSDDRARVADARAALADARYLEAVDALAGLSGAEADALRREAADAWARGERERAGHLFIEARQLPPGNERIASLRAVRAALLSINQRFPDNSYAAAIQDNIAKVDADLAAAGARP
jgi:hypothetical protein